MRREVTVTLEEEGVRLTFRIRQMPATRLESWLLWAAQTLGAALDLPEGAGLESLGPALEKNGWRALTGVDFAAAKELMDEMLGTASRVLDGAEYPCTPDTVDGYIGDVRTLMRLRAECFKANLGFFGQDDRVPGAGEGASRGIVRTFPR